MNAEKPELPEFEDVLEAGRRGHGVFHRTPVMRSRRINERHGAELFFKCENLQRMGAFKFRGAYNAIAKLGAARLAGGLVTYSAGNHGQAVALSARLLGVPCTVVMPKDAPQTKIEATRGYGATVVLYDRYTEDRVQISETLAREQGAVIIPPYDHFDVIAGQGTATQELLDEVGALDALLVPLGGGGLLAGALLAARAMAPACRVFGVEPQAGNDGQQSLRAGHIVSIDAPQTIADGAQTKYLGQLNFAIIRRDVTDIVTATDAQLLVAMRELAATLKLVVEPTGCLGLAALDALGDSLRGQRVGVILSGGNVDLPTFGAMVQG